LVWSRFIVEICISTLGIHNLPANRLSHIFHHLSVDIDHLCVQGFVAAFFDICLCCQIIQAKYFKTKKLYATTDINHQTIQYLTLNVSPSQYGLWERHVFFENITSHFLITLK